MTRAVVLGYKEYCRPETGRAMLRTEVARPMAKIMISLPDAFLKKVDRTAKAQGRSRSELIREALRDMLTRQESGRPSWKAAIAPLKELEQQWVGRWNSTDIIRYYRETRYGRQDRR